MPVYMYKAKNEAGRIFSGEVNIASQNDLSVLLTQKGFTPIEIQEKNIFTDITQISFLKPKVKI
ncbi:MAG: type II secretion system F family protein, partial [Clostridia bacterium]|nr:type II secretion system F family protein [Clostridia bacterium]